MPRAFQLVLVVAVLHACALAQCAFAGDATEVELASAITREGTIAYLGAAVLMPLVTGGPQGEGQATRTVDAIASAAVVTKVLKELTQEPRPDGTGNDSFPSQHAATAFAAATMASDYNPDQAPYWYAGAALIAWSRVRTDRHRTRDVVAGAVIGYGIAKLETTLPRGLLISPFLNPEGSGGGVELIAKF